MRRYHLAETPRHRPAGICRTARRLVSACGSAVCVSIHIYSVKGCVSVHNYDARVSQRRSRPTLRQVADAAGVSVMTASYVYSQPERVAPGTAVKVRAAAERLGLSRPASRRPVAAPGPGGQPRSDPRRAADLCLRRSAGGPVPGRRGGGLRGRGRRPHPGPDHRSRQRRAARQRGGGGRVHRVDHQRRRPGPGCRRGQRAAGGRARRTTPARAARGRHRRPGRRRRDRPAGLHRRRPPGGAQLPGQPRPRPGATHRAGLARP